MPVSEMYGEGAWREEEDYRETPRESSPARESKPLAAQAEEESGGKKKGKEEDSEW